MSGCGADCRRHSRPTATDDPGLAFNEGEVDTAPTQLAFQGRELIVQAMGRTVRVAKELGPSGLRGLPLCTPLQGKSFRKAVSAVMDNLGMDDDHRITLTE